MNQLPSSRIKELAEFKIDQAVKYDFIAGIIMYLDEVLPPLLDRETAWKEGYKEGKIRGDFLAREQKPKEQRHRFNCASERGGECYTTEINNQKPKRTKLKK